MATTVFADLIPGDLVVFREGEAAVFVQRGQHPFWGGFDLMVWRHINGDWHHDALARTCAINGTLMDGSPELRRARLAEVFTVQPGKPLAVLARREGLTDG